MIRKTILLFTFIPFFFSPILSKPTTLDAPISRTSKEQKERSKQTSYSFPLYLSYAKDGAILGGLVLACLYWYGIYKGALFVKDNGPTFFSKVTDVVKNHSAKVVETIFTKKDS